MKTRVLVLFGGQSVEHEVAIISAVQAMTVEEIAAWFATCGM